MSVIFEGREYEITRFYTVRDIDEEVPYLEMILEANHEQVFVDPVALIGRNILSADMEQKVKAWGKENRVE